MTVITVDAAGRAPIESTEVEFVERKGVGHPDTLADSLAEALSVAYSRYTMERFGCIANHWVDKCVVFGGQSQSGFGRGEMVTPIKLFVFGKAVQEINGEDIPIDRIFREAAEEVVQPILPLINVETDLVVIPHTNNFRGPGRTEEWYRPAKPRQMFEVDEPVANDTVFCSGYAPLSDLEYMVLTIEQSITAAEFRAIHPEIGTDVKVFGRRRGSAFDFSIVVPFVAQYTPDRAFYDRRKAEIVDYVRAIVEAHLVETGRSAKGAAVSVGINKRDTETSVYMSHLGGCADTGDVGVVGRGNRANGLISPCREMSIEAPAGKNPHYHSGKIYSVLAQQVAEAVYLATNIENYVTIFTDTGRKISDPTSISIRTVRDASAYVEKIEAEVNSLLKKTALITESFIQSTSGTLAKVYI